jgi:hypothetical protein
VGEGKRNLAAVSVRIALPMTWFDRPFRRRCFCVFCRQLSVLHCFVANLAFKAIVTIERRLAIDVDSKWES